ncbi:MAG TPA: hypothetical protein VI977_06985 [archaeon]|nr:hypothetical protein [archaeon]
MPFFKRRKANPGEKFPNLRKERIGYGAWKFKFIPEDATQAMVPPSKHLPEKLGIKPGEKILVFAGCNGDWADALAQSCEVHYTDLSKQMSDFARKKHSGKIRSFRTRPAQLQPRRKRLYDWSFSFEPYPLVFTRNFKLALARALLNRKGAIIAYQGSTTVHKPDEMSEEQTERIAGIYGAKAKLAVIKIGDFYCRVATLRTNFFARRRVTLDLKVMHFLNHALKKGGQISNQELASLARASLRDIEKSRERLHALEEVEY